MCISASFRQSVPFLHSSAYVASLPSLLPLSCLFPHLSPTPPPHRITAQSTKQEELLLYFSLLVRVCLPVPLLHVLARSLIPPWHTNLTCCQCAVRSSALTITVWRGGRKNKETFFGQIPPLLSRKSVFCFSHHPPSFFCPKLRS